MSKKTINNFRLLPIAAAILLAYGNAYAEEGSGVHDMITPGNSVTLGLGALNSGNDAKRFSQYTGLNQSASLLLDFEINKRDDETGTWMMFNGRNLGLDTRELSYSRSKQGDWKYALDYNEIVRRDPYIIHTGMTGVGTTTPTIVLIAKPSMPAAWSTANGLAASNGVAGNDVELKLKRTAVGFSGDKWFTPEIQVEVSIRDEIKKGARMFGRAGLPSSDMGASPASGNGSWAVLLTPEPIDSSTKQLEGKVNFNRDKLALTGGYYGSFYTNNNGSLSPIVPGTLNRGPLGAAVGTSSSVQQLASAAVALPPDNQAHQLYATGNYAFSDTTRGNFKVAYTHATQNENFTGMGLTPATTAPASLGGVVNTTLAQVGVTMRPLQELSVNGSLRYEDRADKTPIAVYNTNGVATNYGLNNTNNWASGSQTRTSAKLDGIYRLASGYSVLLGTDWERKASPLPPANTALFANQVYFRPVLNEYGGHTELRKALSETLNGAIGVDYKQRRGNDNDWVTASGTAGNAMVAFNPSSTAITCSGTGTVTCTTFANKVLPDMYMDRNRTKVRANLDWEANEQLSMQTVLEHTQDDFLRAAPTLYVGWGANQAAALAALKTQVVPNVPGARKIIGDSFTVDSTYRIVEDWRVNGFWTHSFNRWNVNKASLSDDTRNTVDTAGLGFSGQATSSLSIGMDVLMTLDTTTYTNLVTMPSATAASNPNAAGNIPGWTGQTLPGNYLPTIHYRTSKVNLHGKYALDKVSDVQVVMLYQQFKTDDWQWGYNGVPFVYSDNTTVSQPMQQILKFIGASYALKF